MKAFLHSLILFAALFPVTAAGPFKIENGQLLLPGPIVFKSGLAELDEGVSAASLKHVQEYLAEKMSITTLRIEGHTDGSGKAEANQKLSEQRALAVAQWLVAHGVDCQRLVAVGFGGTKPVADGSTPQGRAQNQRITVVNAALRGRAIGGMPIEGGGQLAGNPCK